VKYFANVDSEGYVRASGSTVIDTLPPPVDPDWSVQEILAPLPSPPEAEGWTYHVGRGRWEDTRPLPDIRAAKWAEIKVERDAREYGGFVYEGGTYDSSRESQLRILASAQASNRPGAGPVDWVLADNTVRRLTPAALLGLGQALAAYVNAVHARATELRALIESATTAEQVKAITWTS
jgi:hypothetical protein